MNRETIERAAMETARKACAHFDEAFEYANGFVTGANWRINSVWHDAETEIPRENKAVIGITGGNYCCYMGLCGETAKEICPEMAKWAYVSDLTPDRKEADQ